MARPHGRHWNRCNYCLQLMRTAQRSNIMGGRPREHQKQRTAKMPVRAFRPRPEDLRRGRRVCDQCGGPPRMAGCIGQTAMMKSLYMT